MDLIRTKENEKETCSKYNNINNKFMDYTNNYSLQFEK